jgi:hypothetical protein
MKNKGNITVSLKFFNDVIKLVSEVQEVIKELDRWNAELVTQSRLDLVERICEDIENYVEEKIVKAPE